jgi:hypothetical protein
MLFQSRLETMQSALSATAQLRTIATESGRGHGRLLTRRHVNGAELSLAPASPQHLSRLISNPAPCAPRDDTCACFRPPAHRLLPLLFQFSIVSYLLLSSAQQSCLLFRLFVLRCSSPRPLQASTHRPSQSSTGDPNVHLAPKPTSLVRASHQSANLAHWSCLVVPCMLACCESPKGAPECVTRLRLDAFELSVNFQTPRPTAMTLQFPVWCFGWSAGWFWGSAACCLIRSLAGGA